MHPPRRPASTVSGAMRCRSTYSPSEPHRALGDSARTHRWLCIRPKPEIQALYYGRQFKARLEELVRTAASHPKMAALLEVVLEHFRDAAAGNPGAEPSSSSTDGAGGAPGAAAAAVSRVIVFTNLRDSVASICALLARHAPLVTAKCASAFPAHGACSMHVPSWQQPRAAHAPSTGLRTWCMQPY